MSIQIVKIVNSEVRHACVNEQTVRYSSLALIDVYHTYRKATPAFVFNFKIRTETEWVKDGGTIITILYESFVAGNVFLWKFAADFLV